MRENRRRALRMVLFLIFLVSAGILLYDMVVVPKQNQELTEQLKESFPEETPGDASPKREDPPAGETSEVPALDFAALQAAYPDVKGWLSIPGTGIDYPVLQSSQSDPQFYLRHSYRKEWDVNGSLFLQWNCEVSETPNLVIYGHNMNSGQMFGKLESYRDFQYWQAHKSVFFQTINGTEEYGIAAVFTADTGIFPFQQVVFESGDISGYLAQARQLSVFETGVFQTDLDHVLTLVTCAYEWEGARMVVVAVEKG